MPAKPHFRLSRLLRPAVTVALAGVLLAVSVAWVSALFFPFPSSARQSRGEGISRFEWWSTTRKSTFGGVRYHSVVMPRAREYEERNNLEVPPAWAMLPAPQPTNSFHNDHYEIADGRGWPLPCLSSRFSADSAPRAKQVTGAVTGGLAVGEFEESAWYDPRVLPLTPIWAGLLANVSFYSLMIGLLWFGSRRVRRAWRTRRHRCPQCGYDLTGATHNPCPECGEPLRPRWVRLLDELSAAFRLAVPASREDSIVRSHEQM